MHTLAIIDMQPRFNAWYKPIVNPLFREIDLAIKNRYPIIVVEYLDAGPTYNEIRKRIGNYDRVYLQYKNRDSASDVIKEIAVSKHVRVCGVNTDACVLSTVCGLYRAFFNVQVVADACWSTYDGCYKLQYENHIWGLNQMRKLSKSCIKIMRDKL